MLLQNNRRRSRRLIILVTLVLLFFVYKFFPLLRLLAEDGTHDSMTSTELFKQTIAQNQKGKVPNLIPKIIHQTYKNESIPVRWQKLQAKIFQYHSDYEYMFWTDNSALDFIKTHYSAYLDNYASYEYPIQRADALRYFVLYHYGGIHLDLDITPYMRLDPLLSLPAWACLTSPLGISNDAMGCTPNHPFFLQVINSLKKYNINWIAPYITVMASTGPLFISLVWKEWINSGRSTGDGRVRVLEPQGRGYGFFGRSWQGRDEPFIAWFERHWLFTMLLIVSAVIFGSDVALMLFDIAWKKIRRRQWIPGFVRRWRTEWYEDW